MKLTLKQLNTIVSLIRSIEDVTITKDLCKLSEVINIMFTLYFGENNTDYIWSFILDDPANQFSCTEELYDYLSDKYSELVRKDSALTVDQLKQLFPEEKMFKFFEKYIKDCVEKIERSQRLY